jgi:hypothetical protein
MRDAVYKSFAVRSPTTSPLLPEPTRGIGGPISTFLVELLVEAVFAPNDRAIYVIRKIRYRQPLRGEATARPTPAKPSSVARSSTVSADRIDRWLWWPRGELDYVCHGTRSLMIASRHVLFAYGLIQPVEPLLGIVG